MTDTPAPGPAFWTGPDVPQPTPAPASPFFKSAPVPAAPLDADGKPQFWGASNVIGEGGTPEQAIAFAEARVALGQITEAQANEGLKARGDGEYVDDAPDTRSEAAKEWDASFAPAQPAEIKVDYITNHLLPPGTDPSVVGQFDGLAREWASEVQLPGAIAGSLIERAMAVGQSAARMQPRQLALWKQNQKVIFDRQHGDRAQALRAYANQVLLSAKNRADFANGLIQNPGITEDAMILSWLGLHGERLAARSKM